MPRAKRIPSVDTIAKSRLVCGLDEPPAQKATAARIVHDLIKLYETGETTPLIERTRHVWEKEAWALGGTDTVAGVMAAINWITGGYGVEYIASRQDTMHRIQGLLYVNTGETYRSTIVHDARSETWRVCSWGDIVERDERRFGE